MITDDKTTQYLIAMLKAYKINKIVASPGMQNAGFNLIVQDNSFFECHSVIDERSAAYVASGMAYETNEPVVITCTGATASRNYLSAMTEAYYRKLPIIAITFTHYGNKFNLEPQYVDRSIIQNDIKAISVDLPIINNDYDKNKCLIYLNAVLSKAVYNKVPVHINVTNKHGAMTFNTKELPSDIWTTKVYDYSNIATCFEELKNKNVALLIGSHKKFSDFELNTIQDFVVKYNIPVFCDHTSNYRGKNKILITHVSSMKKLDTKPDLIIDIGEITGEYATPILFKKAKVWRVANDFEYKCRYGIPVEKIFNMSESLFFESLNKSSFGNNCNYYKTVYNSIKNIEIPEDLPLSNALVCKCLSEKMPKNSSLHLSILNSLRNMNFFNLDNSIDVNCNVGGFGIDGPLSTLVGQSFVNKNKKYFGLIGDLAFFYDMNALGIKEISNNLRIILVNNSRGEEFRLNPQLEEVHHNKTDFLVAAQGHNKGGAGGWAESCGFIYMNAKTRDEFLNKINEFFDKDCDKPVLFEVITNDNDEKEALRKMKTYNKRKKNILDILSKTKEMFKDEKN